MARVEDGWAFVPGAAGISPGTGCCAQFREDGAGEGFSAIDLRAEEGGLRVRCRFPSRPATCCPGRGHGRAEFTRLARKEMDGATPSDGARFLVSVSRGR